MIPSINQELVINQNGWTVMATHPGTSRKGVHTTTLMFLLPSDMGDLEKKQRVFQLNELSMLSLSVKIKEEASPDHPLEHLQQGH